MRLGAFFNPTGHHVASWRHPDADADAGWSIEHYIRIAKTAERAKFDLVFLADNTAMREAAIEALSRSAQYVANMDPLTIICGLATVTERIGLVATATTSYNEPFHVARRFASLDHMSHGRAGWNLVTSGQPNEGTNFGRETHYPHDERYRRAHEFAEIVTALWDSWDDDAFLCDKESGRFFRPDAFHYLDHKGEYFSVKGPLNVPRSPQGRPVVVEAGTSEAGTEIAAKYAEVVFSAHLTLDQAQAYYRDVRQRMRKYGREPDHLKVLPGLAPIVGRTAEEAEAKNAELQALIHPIVAREILSTTLGGFDLSGYSLDDPLPQNIPMTNSSRSTFDYVIDVARRENLTIRQIAYRVAGARAKAVVVGTPEAVADRMQDWFENGGCDGFNIMPPYLPGALDDFVELVIPELQRRGLFRTEYEGRTLRENLGLPRPPSRHTRAEAAE
jgi:alkanesulfonate monooxygenase